MKIDALTWGVIEANYIGGPLGTMFSAHVFGTIPNFLALQWQGAGVPFFDESCGVCMDRRFIALTEAPGLGLTLDQDVAPKYTKPDEEFIL